MGERWIQECSQFIKQIQEALVSETPDRLDLVSMIHNAMLAINHSVWGWLQYAANPDIMGKFSLEELNEMSNVLNKFAEEFVSYDIKVTKTGIQKGLSDIRQRQEQRQQSFYV